MNIPTNNDNVVNLHGEKSNHVRSEILMKESLARLPRPIQRVREVAQIDFKAAIHNLFDHVDDSLFELADRAASNLEQNHFFESMREIRIQRRAMEKRFLFHVDTNFALLVEGYADTGVIEEERSSVIDTENDDLSLVSKEELEELVAIDSFVAKSDAHNRTLLSSLTTRINGLVSIELSESNFPLSPRALADSFVDATVLIKIDIKAKLVLFKLFERYVINELASALNKISRVLTEEGVPVPKTALKRPPTRQGNPNAGHNRHASNTYTESGSAPNSNGLASYGSSANNSSSANSANNSHAHSGAPNDLYATLQSLLQNQPRSQGRSSFSNSSYADHQLDNYGVTEVSYALMTALSHLQQQVQVAPTSVSDDGQPILLSNGHIQTALNNVAQNEQVDERSQDVIKLVDMLFSFILEDENLPDPVKLLLSRLQIPFIKVALSDEEFFKKEGHPARRLLNEMAMASIGLSSNTGNGKQDALLKKIESTVNKVLSDFNNNFEIFTLLLTDFIAFMEKERRRVMLFEKRALDAEDGKAKAEVGRREVDAHLDLLLKGRGVPEVHTSFIKGPWSNILFLAYMRQGKDSQQWEQAFRVAKELVYSALSIKNDEHKRKLGILMPRLKVAIKNGLNNIAFNPVKQGKFLEQFEEHYQTLLLNYNQQKIMKAVGDNKADVIKDNKALSTNLPEPNISAALEKNPPDESIVGKGDLNHSVLEKELLKQASSIKPQVAAEHVSLSNNKPKPEASGDVLSTNDHAKPPVSVEQERADEEPPEGIQEKPTKREEIERQVDLVRSSPKSLESEATTKVTVANSQYTNLVDNFTVGIWFEKKDGSEVSYRCRLAAIIRTTGKYIFVNRSGVKVAEETQESLALQLQEGRLRTLDDGMLFDRALESVIKNLRKP